VRNGGVFALQQELTATGGGASDQFGYSVSASGDTAIIGARTGNSGFGAAYAFVRSSGVWSQQAELTASDGGHFDFFGGSVSLAGDTVLIGASGKNSSQGAAYVFARSGSDWTQQQKLTALDGGSGDQFGVAVSLSGGTAAIGAVGRSTYQGAVYIFGGSSGGWSQQQEIAADDGAAHDDFGSAVAVAADTVVIGAWDKNSAVGVSYIYVRSGGVWTLQQELTASDDVAAGFFGSSVSVSGDTVVIGAEDMAVGRGAAYVFVRPRLGTSALMVGSAGGTSSVELTYSDPGLPPLTIPFCTLPPGAPAAQATRWWCSRTTRSRARVHVPAH